MNSNNSEWMLIDKVGDVFYYKSMDEMADKTGYTKSELYAIIHFCRRRLNRYSPKHKVYIQRLFNNPQQHQPSEKMMEWNFDRKNQYLNYWINLKVNGSFKKIKINNLTKIEYADGCENNLLYNNIINGENKI